MQRQWHTKAVTLTSEERILLQVVESEAVFHTTEEAIAFAKRMADRAQVNFTPDFEAWLREEMLR